MAANRKIDLRRLFDAARFVFAGRIFTTQKWRRGPMSHADSSGFDTEAESDASGAHLEAAIRAAAPVRVPIKATWLKGRKEAAIVNEC